MKIWNVGDKAKTVDGECTVMALNPCVAAIQYTENERIEIVGFDELFSPADEKAVKEMKKLYQDGTGPDEFCEMLYLAGYRKRTTPAKGMTDPLNWRAGDWLKCLHGAPDLTVGKTYQMINLWEGNPTVIGDDADYSTLRPAFYFRFHSRP